MRCVVWCKGTPFKLVNAPTPPAARERQPNFSIFRYMAIPIQTIPILTGKQAKRFLEIAHKNEAEKAGTLDFSEHFSMVKRILSRSKIK